jgi:hypothetical protein
MQLLATACAFSALSAYKQTVWHNTPFLAWSLVLLLVMSGLLTGQGGNRLWELGMVVFCVR